MFDLRNKIKIFVANGEVRYGPRVDPGFFPVFSVQEEEDAKALIEALPWACTDSLTTYARRLESMCEQVIAAETVSQSEEFLSMLELKQKVESLCAELGPSGRDIKLENRDYLYPDETRDKRALLRESLTQLKELKEKLEQPSPIALAIMEASDDDDSAEG